MKWWEAGFPRYDEDEDDQPADDDQPSIMRQLLSDEDAERLEITPGRWYLPGTPP